MPESKKRKTQQATYKPPRLNRAPSENPGWLVPTMVTLFIVGVLWILVYYVSQAKFPIDSIDNWNLAVGFAFLLAGFVLTTRWK